MVSFTTQRTPDEEAQDVLFVATNQACLQRSSTLGGFPSRCGSISPLNLELIGSDDVSYCSSIASSVSSAVCEASRSSRLELE